MDKYQTQTVSRARTCIDAAIEAHRILSGTAPCDNVHQASSLLKSLQDNGQYLSQLANQQILSFEQQELKYIEELKWFSLRKKEQEQKQMSLENKRLQIASSQRREEENLRAALSKKRSADYDLEEARQKLKNEQEKFGLRVAAGTARGTVAGAINGAGAGAGIGALFGLIGGPIGIPIGAAIGSIVGATAGTGGGALAALKYSISREEEAEAYASACCDNVDEAERKVHSSRRSLESLEDQIRSCESSIRMYSSEIKKVHDKIAIIKSTVAFANDAIYFWNLFKNLSHSATKHTENLQRIVDFAQQQRRYDILTPNGGMCSLQNSFLQAWEKLSQQTNVHLCITD